MTDKNAHTHRHDPTKTGGRDTGNPDTPMHTGNYLRAAREHKALSAQDVSQTLRIPEKYILALEGMDTAALPPMSYALGYIRSYAHFLELDSQSILTGFKRDIQIQNLKKRQIKGPRRFFTYRRSMKLPRGFIPAILLLMNCMALALSLIHI